MMTRVMAKMRGVASAWGGTKGWISRSSRETRASASFLLWELVASLISFAILIALTTVFILCLVGVGWWFMPRAMSTLRRWSNVERTRVGRFAGIDLPEEPQSRTTFITRRTTPLRDASVHKELTWLLLHGTVGLAVSIIVVFLPLEFATASSSVTYWWAVPDDEPLSPIYAITSWPAALGMVPVAIAALVLTLVLAPRVARWKVSWTTSLLSDVAAARLENRVSELTRSRTSALEAHGIELRRIERNLHDGAQNRLVAVVMHLGIAERAIERNSPDALALVRRAQEIAQDALADLRETVRGMYPPALSLHGLGGAISALAADTATPVTVDTSGLTRAPAAVEAAAYYSIAETLTNVEKHSSASSVYVSATSSEEDQLVVTIFDDGVGGANEHDGTGLSGIRQRVDAFDGLLQVSSPAGGPTVVRIELPCG